MATVNLTAGVDTVIKAKPGTSINGGAYGSQIGNLIDGLAGIDTLIMDDRYQSGYFTLTATADGILSVTTSSGATTYKNFEKVQFSNGLVNLGTAAIDSIVGTAGADAFLFGLGGNDTIDGGAGADKMYGGLGDDTYILDVATDIASELAGQGTDTIKTALTYSLADTDGAGVNGGNIENLILTGAAAINGTGNALNNVITGNAAVNILNGGLGNDTLDGGLGNDTLIGGLGNDVFVVSAATDIVTELAAQGTDTIKAAITYNLTDTDGAGANGGNVENLILTGAAAINGTGNALNNGIIGNAAVNILTGGLGNDTLDGGLGNDTLIGGLGNDIYVVNVATDIVTELAAQGTDTINAAITYNLTDTDGAGVNGGNVENLTLTGAAAINGTGNALNNGIIGNAAVNILTGGAGDDYLDGGIGNDTLLGGIGNDTYVVSAVTDIVTELAGQGTDTVRFHLSYNLADSDGAGVNGGNVENLILTGTLNTTGYGNALNNVITGNSGNNIIRGLAGNDNLNGGLGNDNLSGSAGVDRFIFTTALGATNIDTIIDYSVAADTIQIDNAIFTAVGAATGVLAAAQFWTGAAAHDADDRILYNSATGAVSYDADGNGAGAAVQFATVTTNLAMTNAEFVII